MQPVLILLRNSWYRREYKSQVGGEWEGIAASSSTRLGMDRASNSIQCSGSKSESRNRINWARRISNYLTDLFRGEPKENRRASLTIVKETKDGDYKRVDHSGPPEGLGK
jgi:hypothetical protein